MRFCRRMYRCLCLILLLLPGLPPAAETVRVAVAANFAHAIDRLAPLFEAQEGHRLVLSTGSTGVLYAQIRQGAPFDVFLAADRERPEKLLNDGLARADSLFVYARGRLALWWPGRNVKDGTALLRRGEFTHLALANPATAPYGKAALQTLVSLGLDRELAPHFVRGESIAQTFQFVASGNAEAGFVALSLLRAWPAARPENIWLVPTALHEPIEQAAVLLMDAKEAGAAQAFLSFLRSSQAQGVLVELGYAPPRGRAS